MLQTINSIILLAYELSVESEEEARSVVGAFVCDRITKGNYSEEFAGRIATQPRVSQFYWTVNSSPIVYQIIEFESRIAAGISRKAFITLVKEHINKNLRIRYPDGDFDKIKKLKILDHRITRISKDDSDQT